MIGTVAVLIGITESNNLVSDNNLEVMMMASIFSILLSFTFIDKSISELSIDKSVSNDPYIFNVISDSYLLIK